jgi:hypothetical protein
MTQIANSGKELTKELKIGREGSFKIAKEDNRPK